MSLHGDINVTGHKIGSWTARRLQHPPAQFNDYDCKVWVVGLDGVRQEAEWTLIGHAFSNGAVSLASRILGEAQGHLKVVDNG